jgi:hypothetical protein
MEASLQASNGPPRTRKRFVDNVQRVAAPPARAPDGSLARETLTLVVGGTKVPVEVVRRALPRGGAQAHWLCPGPGCGRPCLDLFVVGNSLRCRICGGLDYKSRHVLHPALTKAAKLRRKLGAALGLMSKLPSRPPHWRSDYWDRTVAELAAAESVITDLLGAILRDVKRRKARLDGPG